MKKVQNGNYVQVHYTGTLEDDTIFDSSAGRHPLEFQVGSGTIIPGFNDAVLDMKISEEKQVTLSPEQAYGPLREDLKREFPKEMLGDTKIEVGQELRFTSPRGPIMGKVLAIEADKFQVDIKSARESSLVNYGALRRGGKHLPCKLLHAEPVKVHDR